MKPHFSSAPKTRACRHLVVFGLGSNLGDRLGYLRDAAAQLCKRAALETVRRSQVYATAPLGPPQPDYLNAALGGETALTLPELLAIALAIEAELGRKRDARLRWGPRVIDIDVLWSSQLHSNSPGLTVPHPGLTARAFALRPLLDVVPDAHAPGGHAYAELPAAQSSLEVRGAL